MKVASTLRIKIKVSSIDRFRKVREFHSIEGARKFAHGYVGAHPDVSFHFDYAVSDDGINKIEWEGCTSQALFPPPV